MHSLLHAKQIGYRANFGRTYGLYIGGISVGYIWQESVNCWTVYAESFTSEDDYYIQHTDSLVGAFYYASFYVLDRMQVAYTNRKPDTEHFKRQYVNALYENATGRHT